MINTVRNALPIAIILWAIILLACAKIISAGNLYGIIHTETRAVEGVPVDVVRCHYGDGKYPYPKPYASTTTDQWGMYEFCLPDDWYIVTPWPIEGREITPVKEIVEIKPCN